MEEDRCFFCGKNDHNFVNILQTATLKHKIETCLPIVVTPGSVVPQIICTVCQEDVQNFYTFINNCIDHITKLEAKLGPKIGNFESCLKVKRKRDVLIHVEPIDLPIKLLEIPKIETFHSVVIKPEKLVDYDSLSDSDDEIIENAPTVKPKAATNNNLIEEIVERKNLKRKIDTTSTPNECKASKIAKLDASTASRRKKNPPKKISYHLEESAPPNDIDKAPQSCLLCDKQFPGFVDLTNHIFEVHGLDFTQIYSDTPPTNSPTKVEEPPEALIPPRKKLPELVKISDLNLGKLGSKLTIELVEPNKEHTQDLCRAEDSLEIIPTTQECLKPTMASLNDSLFICNECPNSRRSFSNFTDFSTHRRSQHSIFHCDLCPKFYGRNSHLWKHVNRVHKGHASVTCSECGKTSASEYHLQQHKNKMHSNLNSTPRTDKTMEAAATVLNDDVTITSNNVKPTHVSKKTTVASNNSAVAKKVAATNNSRQTIEGDIKTENNSELLSDIELSDDENDILNRKFEGFDFNSVKQSFLRQELLDKRERYVNILKKNNILGENETIIDTKSKDTSPPKEIDASSDLYTTIITNYSRPTNDGPYKCPKCHKGFHKKGLLKKHKKNCRPKLQKDLLTRCKTCSRIFKDRQSLSKHLTNYHSKYSCELCDVTVSSKCEIISHIRFSHPACSLKCEHCGQILRSKSELGSHRANVQNSFICTYCGDSLTTKIRLKMHILSLHRKILSLSCGICLKLFESQYILRNHVKLAHHHQLKRFVSCTICGKNYGTRWKTLDHINKSHGRIFKACKVCLDVFETDRELERHLELEHANVTAAAAAAVPQQHQPTTKSVELHSCDIPPPLLQPEPIIIEPPPVVYKLECPVESLEQQSDDPDQPDLDELDAFEKPAKLTTLLEKRLLGQSTTAAGGPDDALPSQDDIFQNSSKRTVYINSNSPSRCEICLKVWPAKKHLWQHLIRCHKQTAATVCGICLKTNPSYSALERHLQLTHPNLLHGQGFGSNFICKICGRYHNASSKLRLHMAIHVGYSGGAAGPDIDHGGHHQQQQEEEVEMEDEDMSQGDIDIDITSQNQTLNDSNEENEDQMDSDGNSEENSEDAEEPEEAAETSGSDIGDRSLEKFDEKDMKNEFEDDNYYESLIEEVEASSEEENEENSEAESDVNNPEDMEKEMLKNMIGECRSQRLTVKSEPLDSASEPEDDADAEPFSPGSEFELDIKDEFVKSEQNSEVDEEATRRLKDETSADEGSTSGDETPPDELDSAIRSISFGQAQLDEEVVEETDEELELDEAEVAVEIEPEQVDGFKRIHRVNESELETAVGSIL